jgi:flagellar hook-associated protein 1 FlgK
MSGLFESLTSAANALDAQRMGLDVVGQNLANVNTPGYSRRVLVLGELPPTDPRNAGRGVEVLAVQAQRDRYVDDRLRREQQGAAFTDAQIQNLTSLQAGIGLPGAGLDAQLGSFFDSFSSLANDVTSPTSRDVVVAQGRSLAQTFGALADRLASSRRDADNSIRGAVDDVNNLAAQVAALNNRITSVSGAEAEALRDQRSVALTKLSQLVGVTVTERIDGPVDVSIGQGLALVVGKDAFHVDMSALPSGMTGISIGGTDITSELNQGQIGGLLQVRDTIVPGYATRLDQLAYDIATQVNAVHSAGFDGTGAPAGDFFVQPAVVAGAAAAFDVDPAVAANSALVAGSSTGASGDNQTARAIAALRDTRVMSGGTATPAEAWGQFVYHVGADIASAQSAGDTHAQIVLQLQRLQGSASGVSMDEEAAWLMKYQRAYEASARYFTTVNTAIDTLMTMVATG